VNTQTIRQVGQFSIPSAAFLRLGRFTPSSPLSLLATAFGVFSGDGLYYIENIDLDNINSTNPTIISQDVLWPNEPAIIPTGTIKNYNKLVIVGGGFLVPTKGTGAITIFDLENNFASTEISVSKSGYFYHRVRWHDVNGDGLLDIITARATKPLIGSGSGELIWYQQPASDPLSGPWAVNHLADGPDFLFELLDVNNDGVPEVAAAEFFGEKLTLTYSTSGNWNDPSSIKQTVIDANIGSGFDVRILDISADGKQEIIATNHQGDGTGAVYAYEIPTNWQQGNWPRYTLAKSFPVREPGLNQAAPGAPIPFYPTTDTSGRGWIILSGDGSQCAYELRPISGWEYNITTILNAVSTVGQPAVGDVNGDGYAEVFVPAYDSSTVYVFTYAPQ